MSRFPAAARRAATFAVAIAMFPAFAAAAEKEAFRWETNDETGQADLFVGAQPVVRYMFAYDASTPDRRAETFKPYHHVFGPGTEHLVTKGVGGLYTHHRGLFVGWNKISFENQTIDSWHGRKASQKHVRFVDRSADADGGAMTAEIEWLDDQQRPVIVETRELAVKKIDVATGPGYAWQLDWSTHLESRRGKVRLDGDRQHAGFHFRAAQPVAAASGARFIRPEGFPDQPAAVEVGDAGNPPKHSDLPWVAMTFELEGKRHTVEYFESPGMPRPSLCSERPYGRFGTFFKAELDEGKPLDMRYRLIVSTGRAPTRGEIAKRYEAFRAETNSNPKRAEP